MKPSGDDIVRLDGGRTRVGFHLDFVPMVFMTFLLILFFGGATAVVRPGIWTSSLRLLGVRLSPDRLPDNYAERRLYAPFLQDSFWNLTIGANGDVAGSMDGRETVEIPVDRIERESIRQHLESGVAANSLITIVRIDRSVEYGRVVEVLDALNLAEVEIGKRLKSHGIRRDRRFVFVQMESTRSRVIDTILALPRSKGSPEDRFIPVK